MNRFCTQFSSSCKNVKSFCNIGNVPDKFLPLKLNKNFETTSTKIGNDSVVCRQYSTIPLRVKKGKSCTSFENINGLGSYKLHIRWKGWGYSKFGHRDDEKVPLITKVFYMVPTLGMVCLFIDWPLVLEYAINRARQGGYTVPEAVVEFAGGEEELEATGPRKSKLISTSLVQSKPQTP